MAKRLWVGALGLALCLACEDGTVSAGQDAGSGDGSAGDGDADGAPGDGSDGSPTDGAPGDGDGDGDGGPADGNPGDGDGDGAPDGLVPGIVAVGYGGLRVVSRDHGASWGDAADLYTEDPNEINRDNENLLRGIAWGNGRWIATGFKVEISFDGVTWDPSASFRDGAGCDVAESIVFGNGTFVAACGDNAFLTLDGQTWERGGLIGNTGGGPKIRFAESKFVVAGRNGNSFVSTDGRSWSALEGVSHARVCDGVIMSREDCPQHQTGVNDTEGIWIEDDAWLLAEWGGHIWHSSNGLQYERVYTDAHEANAFGYAAGFVAP